MWIRSCGMVVVVALGSVGSSIAGEPSVADLIKLAPVIQSTDPQVKTIALVGSMKGEGIHLRFRAVYRAPGDYSLLISDAVDGTPLVFVADRQLLYYDPIRSSAVCLKNCYQWLTLEADGKGFGFLYGMGSRSHRKEQDDDDHHHVDFLKIDVRSLFGSREVQQGKVVNEGDGRYRLVVAGNRRPTLVCSFDTTKPQPFESLKLFDPSVHEPFLSVDQVVIDGPLSDSEFRFPDRDRLARKITVHEMAGGFQPRGTEMVLIAKAIRTRFDLKHPGFREDQAPPGYQHQTWKALQKHDLKYSALLRDLVPVDRKAVVAQEEAKPKSAKPTAPPVAGAVGPTVR